MAAILAARRAQGLTQVELARRAGISRQALGALEAGAYQPGVSVALSLARALGVSVERLFGGADEVERIEVLLAGRGAESQGGGAGPHIRVALGRVGGRLVAVPHAAAALVLAPAAGIVEGTSGRRARVEAFRSRAEIDSTLLVAGCDPAVTVMADWLARYQAPVSLCAIPCSSRAAITALSRGEVHVAGVHLRDPKSGDYNLEAVRRALGRRRVMLVNFARWELGLAVAAGNPRRIRGFDDLVRPGVRLVNRESGAGARFALDEALAALKIDPRRIEGYEREVPGHLEVAAAIAAGEADAGVTIRVAAEAYGIGFIPLREERYDLVIPEREAHHAAVRAMLDALNSGRFARELSELCSYDTSQTGRVLARSG